MYWLLPQLLHSKQREETSRKLNRTERRHGFMSRPAGGLPALRALGREVL